MAPTYRLAVIGVGKIARDRHLPAIAADPAFELVATVDPHGGVDRVPNFRTIAALLVDGPAIDAVSICTPPAVRTPIVMAALAAGWHAMIEKPPAGTLAEVESMRAAAAAAKRTLFAAWHSREAFGVAPARAWLAGKRITHVCITWHEDIRRWHPGQDWILEEGGFGVFDPGINALSILTAILPGDIALAGASIDIPAGRGSPIAASLAMRWGDTPIEATFNFLQTGPQTWTITVETDSGPLSLREGGSVLDLAGRVESGPHTEYPRLYKRFAGQIAAGTSDLDATPLRLAVEAITRADRVVANRFDW